MPVYSFCFAISLDREGQCLTFIVVVVRTGQWIGLRVGKTFYAFDVFGIDISRVLS